MPALESQNLAAAHRRFARGVLGIYVGAAATIVGVLLVTVLTDQAHEEEQLRDRLRLEAIEQEHHLSRHLARLVQELRRLGLRSEVDLLDENLAPEKSLLRLSHEGSTFFNLGVAILATDGKVVWSEPPDFLGPTTSLGAEPWFGALRRSTTLRIVPADPNADDAALYVVSPVVRNQRFSGALLGAVDLARDAEVGLADAPGIHAELVIATSRGVVVYPPRPPDITGDPRWSEVFSSAAGAPRVRSFDLLGHETLVATSPVSRTDLVYVLAADEGRLFAGPRSRMLRRLGVGVALALVPLAVLVLLLTRSLRLFRASEERLLREERLQLAGEAANLIAHEVKNALNSIHMAIDIAMAGSAAPARKDRAATELRRELSRLSSFTTELMTFSKGIVLRPIRVDLAELASGVVGAAGEVAAEAGVTLDVSVPAAPVHVRADPSMLHVVLNNLVTNAIEACAGRPDGDGHVDVRLSDHERIVRISVSDNGPGVSEEMKTRLFIPFESGKPSGVGIGLALSKRIAAAHGGDLALLPSEVGALFAVTLPKGGPS